MLRVAIVDAYPQVLGGAHAVHRDIAAAGERTQGWETTVVVPQEGAASSWLRESNVRVLLHPAPPSLLRFGGSWRWSIITMVLALPPWWWTFAKVLRRYDIVHLSDLRGLVLGGPAAVLARRPMLLHAHNGEPGGRMWHLMVRVLLRCGLTVVVPSRQGARTWARAQAARVIELANSVDDRATRVEGPEPTVVTVARLHPDKGLDVLLEAVALLHIRGTALRVLVIGPDASGHDMLAQSLRSRAATLPGVEVRGVVFDPSTLLADAWVYVQPSRREPFGLAALEASASGLPVVASRVGGLPDIVEDEVTGLLVDPGQVSALADALERLIGNADERDRLGRAGADRARTKFGPDVFAERVGALYARVAR